MGFIALILLIVFIVLKLTSNIDWSWIWVLSPFWITESIWLVFFFMRQISEFIKDIAKKKAFNKMMEEEMEKVK